MEDSLVNMLFAEDVIRYVLKCKNIQWFPENEIQIFRDEINLSPFRIEIGKAIIYIMENNSSYIEQCYKNLQQDFIDDRKEFGYHALEAAPLYFEDGYSPESYLAYCALLAGMAFHFDCYPSNGIPDCACELLALVLTSHQLTGEFNKYGGWEGIVIISNALCEKASEI